MIQMASKKSESPEKPEKPESPDKAEQAAKASRAEKAEKASRAAKPDKAEQAAKAAAPKSGGAARIKDEYLKNVVPRLQKERAYPSIMAVPKLQKVVVNMGVGEATQNIKILDAAMEELGRITGQKPRAGNSKGQQCGGRNKPPAARDAHGPVLDRLWDNTLQCVWRVGQSPSIRFELRSTHKGRERSEFLAWQGALRG